MKIDVLLNRLWDDEKRLQRWPRKQKQQFVCLEYVIDKVPKAKQYTEKEINRLIKAWITFEDYVRVRRQLVDFGFLGRTKDGSSYWRL
ncbi:DUF2087 domain-containing protein [Pseudobacteriovorax antillogorgiicola]|uniref:DUF2087 domain-containing protein n=1 Tax=Pseudobacteriovorax antillogorgiicola TaxID=1513793 RepID=A0A1Y6BGP7_9BACT|nr:DUF2087 domain-containing protein [Pseudobacteriovorax antillogorgiicola]TCS56232.1 hypothetical protein EDD56_10454 [Pseudobacteriovorax antillogorgiicola]SMF08238.1 hypothetical protein SAMN06296036_104279 [Pseudobacteriovorax antillogorgiicola]